MRYLTPALIVGLGLLFASIPARAQTAAATGEPSIFFYANGKKHELKASTQWTVVQLDDTATSTSVETTARARRGVDRGRSAVRNSRRKLLALPVSADVTTRKQLRSQLKAMRGVRRVFRAFGSGKLPIVETDEFLIRFEQGTTKARARALLATQGAELLRPLGKYAPNGYVARAVRPETRSATDAANALYTRPEVIWSHPNFLWPKEKRFTPNDTLYPKQWHLNNTGQSDGVGGAPGTVGADIRAASAWDITRGNASIVVAVIDDGLDTSHPDMVGKTVPGYDFIDRDSSPLPVHFDDNHGTACAGLLAANGNNALGVTGVAPDVKIMPIRLIGNFDASDEDEADAFEFAANNGAHIISNSWGPVDNTGEEQPLPDVTSDAIEYAVTQGRGGKGCVIFWAAGNGTESADLDGYASDSRVICVAASTNHDRHAAYSDTGNSVDISAPSDGGSLKITTIDRAGGPGYSGGDYYSGFDGTSAATPIAAGVAALVLSVRPNLTPLQVQQLLQNNADKIDPANGAYDSTGHSRLFGFGRVNAYRALSALGPAPATYTVSGRITTGNVGVAGVTVTTNISLQTATTDSNGNYSISGVPADTARITPAKSGYTFNPVFRDVIVNGNTPNINFDAIVIPAVTLTAPADNAIVGASTTLRAETQGTITGVAFSRRLAASFTRSPGLLIPDYSTTGPGKVTDSGSIATSGVISEASLSVQITHPYRGDLILVLIAPDGSRLTVFDGNGVDADDLNATFSNLALVGKPMAGTWQLEVTDNEELDRGTLVSWSLNLGAAWTGIGNGTQSPTGVWTAPWSTQGTPPGNYQVRAVATHAVGSVSDINSNITVSAAFFNVQGRIANSSGSGIANAVLSLSGSSITATTNSNGDYTLNNVPVGTYTLTPSLSGYSFNPASRSITVSNGNLTAQNFTGTSTAVIYRTISGQVTGSSGSGLANVSLALSGSSITALTNSTGNFTLTNVPSGSYTLSPTLNGYSFTPLFRTVDVTTANATGQNFVAVASSPSTYTLSGQITFNGSGLSGVTVAARVGSVTKTGTTSSTGNYSIPQVPAGSGTVTPALLGYSFTPASRSVNVNANISALNFTAAVAPGITLTSPADGANVGAGTTLRAETRGAIQSVAFARRSSTGFTRTSNLVIPDFVTSAGKVTDSHTVTKTGTIAEATLSVQIEHSYAGDIVIVLIAPDGTRVTVRNQAGGATQNINQTIPNVAVVGKEMAGTWKLEVSDNGFANAGKLVSWGLHLGTAWVSIGNGTQNTTNVWTAPWTTQGMETGTYDVRALASLTAGSVSDVNTNINVVKSYFNISGRIATSSNTGIEGVQVTRSGSAVKAVTDATGNYTFPDVPIGTYTITPALTQYTFSPVSRSVTISNADVASVNFAGTRATYTIRGRITNHSGSAMAGVQVTRTGSPNAVTDADGNYVFTNVISGNYTIAPLITPSLSGVTLYPASRAVTVNTSNLTNQNFTASFTVTGRVVNSLGTGIPNIQVRRTVGSSSVTVATDADGNYRFTDVRSGTYTVQAVVTPSMTGITFFPGTKSITVAKTNLTNINFTAWFSISGKVVNSLGTGIPNIQVTRRAGTSAVTAVTDADGNYRFSDVRSGNYTLMPNLTPAMSGMTLFPSSIAVSVGNQNLTNQNFTVWFSITGRITDSATGQGMAGVQVKRTVGSSTVSVFTDSNGNYRFSEVRSGNYTISAALNGKEFTPASRAVSVGSANITNVNFIGSAG